MSVYRTCAGKGLRSSRFAPNDKRRRNQHERTAAGRARRRTGTHARHSTARHSHRPSHPPRQHLPHRGGLVRHTPRGVYACRLPRPAPRRRYQQHAATGLGLAACVLAVPFIPFRGLAFHALIGLRAVYPGARSGQHPEAGLLWLPPHAHADRPDVGRREALLELRRAQQGPQHRARARAPRRVRQAATQAAARPLVRRAYKNGQPRCSPCRRSPRSPHSSS
jgi:hypothetical protein